MKLFTLILCFFISHLWAGEIKLAEITSEFDRNNGIFLLEVDDKNIITGIRYVVYFPNGGIDEDISVPAERVLQSGAVLVRRNGYDIVRLQVENFSLNQGGTVKLSYLYNGLSGVRHIKSLKLSLLNENFSLTDQTKPINRLFIKVNYGPLGPIGVKEILTSFVSAHLLD